MDVLLNEFMTTMALAFMLTFTRMGTAMMIMPGIGDSFAPQKIRLYIALSISFVLFPLTVQYVPSPMPSTFVLVSLVAMEFVVGLFFGTIARIFMAALDTAGMVISITSGLGNAQVFNPALAMQGSLMGALLSMTGLVFLFVTNLHHLLIAGLMESYELFPLGALPDTGSMAELMARAVAASFAIGFKIGAPFILVTLLIYVGMGVLSRLMPQVQVFIMVLPIQILISVILLAMIMSGIYLYWAGQFEQAMSYFLSAP